MKALCLLTLAMLFALNANANHDSKSTVPEKPVENRPQQLFDGVPTTFTFKLQQADHLFRSLDPAVEPLVQEHRPVSYKLVRTLEMADGSKIICSVVPGRYECSIEYKGTPTRSK